ncbi:hypothetical protein [Microcoleus sp. PH2017_32_RDM_D_A]|uniref:hypothetical protein n=1 Tax=Microcoleus sp. PH2017_32_RDM_D_A TaxID=2798842 RepID=UPI0025E9420B|nr:hypothetical protein [Microcoleus sp. PH2017_32_RDM_D_A]
MAYAPLRYDSSTRGGGFCWYRRGFNRRVCGLIGDINSRCISIVQTVNCQLSTVNCQLSTVN